MDLLYLFIVGVCAFFTVLVAALVVVLHASSTGGGIPTTSARTSTDRSSLELTWTFIPFVLSMVMFGWGADALLPARRGRRPTRWRSSSSASSGCGRCSIPRACARSTSCTCRSAGQSGSRSGSEDVIHDFFIPAFRVKMDVVPGKLTTMWFKATELGTYHIFCARVLRHEALRHDRPGHRDDAAGLRGVARGRPVDRHGRAERRAAVHGPGLHHVPQGGCHAAAGRRSSACSAARCSSPTAARSSPTRTTCASRS